MLSLPAQSQECWRGARRLAFTWGDLERAAEGCKSSTWTAICSFVRRATGEALPERLLVCVFLTKLSESDFMTVAQRPTSLCGTCAHRPVLCRSPDICQRTLELGVLSLAPHSLHRWEQVHTEYMWQATGMRESGDAAVHLMLPATSFGITNLAASQW